MPPAVSPRHRVTSGISPSPRSFAVLVIFLLPALPAPHLLCVHQEPVGSLKNFHADVCRSSSRLLPLFQHPSPPNSSCVRASVLWSLSPSHSETAGLCFPASWGRGRGQRRTCGLTPAASYGLACLQFLRRFCPGVIVAEPMLADRSHKQKTGAALCYSFNSYLHFLYLKLSTPVASEVLKPEGIDYVASSPDSSHLRSPPPVVTAAFLRSCMQSSRDGYFFTVDPRENTACLSWRFVFFQTWKTISLETCKNKI